MSTRKWKVIKSEGWRTVKKAEHITDAIWTLNRVFGCNDLYADSSLNVKSDLPKRDRRYLKFEFPLNPLNAEQVRIIKEDDKYLAQCYWYEFED